MTGIERRQFLQSAAAATVVGSVARMPARAAAAVPAPWLPTDVVDANVYLSHWPFRSLRGDRTADLVQMLRAKGVTQAWAGSFEGLFHADIASVNRRLADGCRHHGEGLLVPFGTVNPRLPGWEEDLRRCHDEHHMPGIRLHPSYHQYALDDPALERLLRMAAERGMVVQLVAWMEDERHQSALMPVPELDLGPLPKLVEKLPELRLVLLNGFRVARGGPLLELMESGRVYYDIALVDVIDPLGDVLQRAGVERVLFGSYSPAFYFDAAPLKLRESALSDSEIDAVCRQNARRLLGPT